MEITLTEKPIKTRDGNTIPKGSPVTFSPGNPSRCFVQGTRVDPYKVPVESAFNAPEFEQLEEWMMDSMCDSVGGRCVEHDGWDSDGTPSWMLVMGLI